MLAGELVVGCPFALRCSEAVDHCLDGEPTLDPVGRDGRLVACSNPHAVDLELVR